MLRLIGCALPAHALKVSNVMGAPPAVQNGDVLLTNPNQVFQNVGIRDLTISADYIGTSVTSAQFPNLKFITGSVTIEETRNLETVDLQVESISKKMTIKRNANLREVKLHQLQNIDDELIIKGNPALKSIQMQEVSTIGPVRPLDPRASPTQQLRRQSSFNVVDNDNLVNLAIDNLTTIALGKGASSQMLNVRRNEELQKDVVNNLLELKELTDAQNDVAALATTIGVCGRGKRRFDVNGKPVVLHTTPSMTRSLFHKACYVGMKGIMKFLSHRCAHGSEPTDFDDIFSEEALNSRYLISLTPHRRVADDARVAA